MVHVPRYTYHYYRSLTHTFIKCKECNLSRVDDKYIAWYLYYFNWNSETVCCTMTKIHIGIFERKKEEESNNNNQRTAVAIYNLHLYCVLNRGLVFSQTISCILHYIAALMLWHFIDVKTLLLNTFPSFSNVTFMEGKKRCRAK